MPSIHTVAATISNAETDFRQKALRELYKFTGNNIICYYSNFHNIESGKLVIDDSDLEGFMSTVYGLDKTKGLDLILHTPGGDPAALESIVEYLYAVFDKNKIRAIVPHMAMSAGTMFACACKQIIMGKHSSLGPIDPQFSGIPAFSVITEYDTAKAEILKSPRAANYWGILLSKYPPNFYERCKKATSLSDELIKKWLKGNMLAKFTDSEEKANAIAAQLNEHDQSKIHNRHFNIEKCTEIGLDIVKLEDDPGLQERVLTVHHSYAYAMNQKIFSKIIENQNMIAVLTGNHNA